MVTLVRLEHESNAELPIYVTLLGIVTPVRLEQALNALPSILVTGKPPSVDGISISPLIDVSTSVMVA